MRRTQNIANLTERKLRRLQADAEQRQVVTQTGSK